MSKKSAVSSSALTLACITAVSIVGYTLISARKKGSSSNKSTPTTRDASDTKDPQEKPTTNPTADPTTTKVKTSIPGQIDISQPSDSSALSRLQASNTITIAYASTTGTCKNFAIALHDALKILLRAQDTKVQMCTTDELDWWDELLNNEEDEVSSNSNHEATTGNGTTAAPVVIFILRKFCFWLR